MNAHIIRTTRTDKTILQTASDLLALSAKSALMCITSESGDWKPDGLQVQFEVSEAGLIAGDSKIEWPFMEPTIVISRARIYADQRDSVLSVFTYGGKITKESIQRAILQVVQTFKGRLLDVDKPYADLTFVANKRRALQHFVFATDGHSYGQNMIQRYTAIDFSDSWLGENQVSAHAGLDEDQMPIVAIYGSTKGDLPITALSFEGMEKQAKRILNISFDKDDDQAIFVTLAYTDATTESVRCIVPKTSKLGPIEYFIGAKGFIETHSIGAGVILLTRENGEVIAMNHETGQKISLDIKSGPIEVRKIVSESEGNPMNVTILLGQDSEGLPRDNGTWWGVREHNLQELTNA